MIDFDALDEAPGGRMYDIIIYGATGYTGCLMAEHLDALLSERRAIPHKWALAGREANKLKELASRCKTDPDIMEVTSVDQIETMADMCHVVLSAAGPFSVCGTPVVKACVEKRTHYIDVTGEVVWMRKIIDWFDSMAKEKGVMIVQCAGAMCAPNDISLYLLAKKLGPLKQFREYTFFMGFQSGGTFLTGYKQYESMLPSDFGDIHLNPFALGGKRACGIRKEDADPRETCQDELYQSLWMFPGHSSHCATRILRRTVHLFEQAPDEGLECGEAVSVRTRQCTLDGKGAARQCKGCQGPQDVRELVKFAMAMEAMAGAAPQPGGGAPRAARAGCRSEAFALAEGEGGAWAHVRFLGPEAYEVTAMAAIAGALVLLEESESVRPRERGGVVTPAFAFHRTCWIERLAEKPFACGSGLPMTFEVREGRPSQEEVEKAVFEVDVANGMLIDAQRKGTLTTWARPELYSKR
mmetsp:Transcript_136789/g.381308  ORF Transcript_136789/g.381308 Transcript_136789/m.381308 type:complete len:468 (+) Transcript_136789:74-1477(+)